MVFGDIEHMTVTALDGDNSTTLAAGLSVVLLVSRRYAHWSREQSSRSLPWQLRYVNWFKCLKCTFGFVLAASAMLGLEEFHILGNTGT